MWRGKNIYYDDSGIPHEAEGEIRVSNEVIADITAHAASDVRGFVRFTETIVDGFAKFFTQGDLTEGILVRHAGENPLERSVEIELSIIVQYGMVVQEVAEEIQRIVKERVEELTNISVVRVHVNVQGIAAAKK